MATPLWPLVVVGGGVAAWLLFRDEKKAAASPAPPGPPGAPPPPSPTPPTTPPGGAPPPQSDPPKTKVHEWHDVVKRSTQVIFGSAEVTGFFRGRESQAKEFVAGLNAGDADSFPGFSTTWELGVQSFVDPPQGLLGPMSPYVVYRTTGSVVSRTRVEKGIYYTTAAGAAEAQATLGSGWELRAWLGPL